mmetsp:Transcript_27071/g.85667  ORF Transcript_27071/g.85667 Transcript_27071/m.85667 type:complete len:261 (+) Transcript_27071:48-830(+)
MAISFLEQRIGSLEERNSDWFPFGLVSPSHLPPSMELLAEEYGEDGVARMGGKLRRSHSWAGFAGRHVRHLELASAGARVLLFDHTVPGPPKRHPHFAFRREALADKDAAGVCGTLASHLGTLGGQVMLKMDVEGAEFAALLATPPEVLARFQQVCIELHWLGRPSRGGDFQTKALALERLNEHFVLLHVHGNSYGDLVEVAGCTLPDVLEALYVNRRLLGPGDVRPSSRGIPDPRLDANNCAFVPDVALAGPPFGAELP